VTSPGDGARSADISEDAVGNKARHEKEKMRDERKLSLSSELIYINAT